MAEQSAILAGRGGFDIRVGGHTQLDGALIASTAAPAKNRLDTATLGWTDIRNDSKTSGDSYSLALSASAGGNNRNLSPATGTGHADQAHSGITTSAISQGDIVIRDNARQTQDIASLSRDTDSTHQRVDIHGDVHKVRDNLAVQSEGMASGLSALDAWGKYTQQQAQQENAALASRLASEGTLDGMDTVQREALLKSHPDYRSTDYGPGSAFHTQGSAAIGLLAGAFGGNIQAGAAAGAAPLLASLVKNVDNATARAALHGMVAAALTQMKGGSAKDGMAAGAAGAATASLLAERLVGALYGKPVDQLTADEKRLVSSLVTLAGAGAGYTAGGDISLAATGADSARVEVENNYLSDKEPETFAKKLANCGDNGSCRAKVMKEMAETSNKNIDGFSDCLKSGDKACINDKLNGIENATGYDALTTQIGADAANTYKEGLGVETFNNAIDCMGMGWEACSNKKGWKLIESGSGVLIIAGGQTIGGKLAEMVAGSKGNASTNIQPGSKQPVQIEKLNQKQESAIRKIDNSIKNGLKDHDITGTLKDMSGNPVPKPGGGYWDHLQEMQNTLRGLRRNAETLKNVNNPEAQAAYRRATDAINKIESAIKGHGI